ncbi:MAG: peroxide stress protein YaaA [Flavobacteriales bacterium]|nr:peroxide stress protein YaaA [Flavobacteriales bacterium]
MITIISPAKSLDFDSSIADIRSTEPSFQDESYRLIKKLRTLSKKKVRSMMNLSKDLTELNVLRYQEWEPEFTLEVSRPAILTFNGEVYRGIDAKNLSESELHFAQDHLRILSGLHGVLRPLDRIRPYRLEMGVTLPIQRKRNLYQFWSQKVTKLLADELEASESKTLINLASSEYFKAVDFTKLPGKVITPIFKDFKNGEYKVIMTWAKNARGRMAGYILRNGITNPENIKLFDEYKFSEPQSSEEEWVFLRG